jgi:hypothetical protein
VERIKKEWGCECQNVRYGCWRGNGSLRLCVCLYIYMRRDELIMGYFDNFVNGSLNKYKKFLKMKKIYICVILYLD